MEVSTAEEAYNVYGNLLSANLGYSLLKLQIKKAEEKPTSYSLSQNYLNPFNPATTIHYKIPVDGFVTIKIYDVLGKEVATLVNENKTAGSYNVTFNADNLARGIYIYRMKTGTFVANKKLVLMK